MATAWGQQVIEIKALRWSSFGLPQKRRHRTQRARRLNDPPQPRLDLKRLFRFHRRMDSNAFLSVDSCQHSLKKMNTRFLPLLAIVFVVGCTTTSEVGNRGDATLHNTKSFWPMIYPYSASFAPVTLGQEGRSFFKVQGLREAAISRFDLQIHSTEPLIDQSGEHLNKSPLLTAGFSSCTLRFVVTDNRGRVAHSKTIRCSEVTWFVESKRKGVYRVSYPIGIEERHVLSGEFSVQIEVIAPSKTAGDYVIVRGLGFPTQRG